MQLHVGVVHADHERRAIGQHAHSGYQCAHGEGRDLAERVADSAVVQVDWERETADEGVAKGPNVDDLQGHAELPGVDAGTGELAIKVVLAIGDKEGELVITLVGTPGDQGGRVESTGDQGCDLLVRHGGPLSGRADAVDSGSSATTVNRGSHCCTRSVGDPPVDADERARRPAASPLDDGKASNSPPPVIVAGCRPPPPLPRSPSSWASTSAAAGSRASSSTGPARPGAWPWDVRPSPRPPRAST